MNAESPTTVHSFYYSVFWKTNNYLKLFLGKKKKREKGNKCGKWDAVYNKHGLIIVAFSMYSCESKPKLMSFNTFFEFSNLFLFSNFDIYI